MFWTWRARRRAALQQRQADREAQEQLAEQHRVQRVVDDLAQRYRADEAREREEAEEADRMRRERARGILQRAVEQLKAGDHRRAWLTLRESSGSCAAEVDTYCADLMADKGLRATAIDLNTRIQWSRNREEVYLANAAHDDALASETIIDFEELDRALSDQDETLGRPREIGCIYSIRMPDGQTYIGQTAREANLRWEEHRREARAGDSKPKSLALRYWMAQGRESDIQWKIEETVRGWGQEDLDQAERRWMRMATLNVMHASRAATLYPNA